MRLQLPSAFGFSNCLTNAKSLFACFRLPDLCPEFEPMYTSNPRITSRPMKCQPTQVSGRPLQPARIKPRSRHALRSQPGGKHTQRRRPRGLRLLEEPFWRGQWQRVDFTLPIGRRAGTVELSIARDGRAISLGRSSALVTLASSAKHGSSSGRPPLLSLLPGSIRGRRSPFVAPSTTGSSCSHFPNTVRIPRHFGSLVR